MGMEEDGGEEGREEDVGWEEVVKIKEDRMIKVKRTQVRVMNEGGRWTGDLGRKQRGDRNRRFWREER